MIATCGNALTRSTARSVNCVCGARLSDNPKLTRLAPRSWNIGRGLLYEVATFMRSVVKRRKIANWKQVKATCLATYKNGGFVQCLNTVGIFFSPNLCYFMILLMWLSFHEQPRKDLQTWVNPYDSLPAQNATFIYWWRYHVLFLKRPSLKHFFQNRRRVISREMFPFCSAQKLSAALGGGHLKEGLYREIK